MPRPRGRRCLEFIPEVYYFKPRGVPLSKLEEEILFFDEIEALKLYEVDELNQNDASGRMEISQPTFARLLDSAQKKVAKAIIEGRAIKIEKI